EAAGERIHSPEKGDSARAALALGRHDGGRLSRIRSGRADTLTTSGTRWPPAGKFGRDTRRHRSRIEVALFRRRLRGRATDSAGRERQTTAPAHARDRAGTAGHGAKHL